MKLDIILATDCGSTTTKAILIEKKDEVYRQTYRGEAPTTVEEPFQDVTRGVLNAVAEVEELSGRNILEGERIITPAEGSRGVDIYVSTSSAGGGLQMVVAGAVKTMTAESAQRCALGAGAIVMDVLAINDGRAGHQKIERVRALRPDMILLSGGTDGGTVTHVVELAEFISAAEPRPRLGGGFRLPVVFAGNVKARGEVRSILDAKTALQITENIRPTLERENLGPAREEIHRLFLEHVMAQAPGYHKLMTWTGAPIMPTPMAVGIMMQVAANREKINVLGVDIGGATTDVFSVFGEVFNRTVSANLGMSYSVSNVLAEAGLENICRWLPFRVEEGKLRNVIKNKMIRPTTIPQTVQELQIEHAVAREALRMALEQHKLLAVGLKGVQQERSISDAFHQRSTGESLIDMMQLNLIVGSGGILSHAPRRVQTAAMLIDAYQPAGITELAVDSIFMMPHLGVLSTIHEKAAMDVFWNDCLVSLGTCVAPVGNGKRGEECLDFKLSSSSQKIEDSVPFGEIRLYDLDATAMAEIAVSPARKFDIGAGAGNSLTKRLRGGAVGLVVDARGRPLAFPSEQQQRIETVAAWFKTLKLYI